MALTDKLSAIGAAIREKGGTTELLTLAQMPDAIAALPTGGGGSGEDCNGLHIPEEALVLTGSCRNKFASNGWNWFVDLCGDKITSTEITDMYCAFYDSDTLEDIPFTINTITTKYTSWYNTFYGMDKLKHIAKIPLFKANYMSGLFQGAKCLRELPEIEVFDYDQTASNSLSSIFSDCFSLRHIPDYYIKNIYTNYAIGTSTVWYYRMFNCCAALEEVKGLRVAVKSTLATNAMNNTVTRCYRLTGFTFETNTDGTPLTVNWKKQTLDFSSYTGWGGHSSAIGDLTTNNTGITRDTEVKDEATYNALKNNPDWWSREVNYSRFNHNSAVELINSLPDASAYLATQTGTGNNNIVKFKQNAGSNTDGGSVSDLTEEEIAVAAAKGWTISYAT